MANAGTQRARSRGGDRDGRSGDRGLAPGAWPFVVSDVVALLVFVLVGLRSHHEATLAVTFLRNAVPLSVAWGTVALVLGTYRRPGVASLLQTWIVAVPIAIVVRSVWVGSPTGGRLFVFLGVALAFTLLFLLIGRAVAIAIGRAVDRGRGQ